MALRLTEVYRVADAVLGCVCSALDEAREQNPALPGCPCRVFVAPGSKVMWDCCSDVDCSSAANGQLTVHLDNISVSDVWPTTGARSGRTVPAAPGCAMPAYTIAEYVVTLLRCVPVMDDQGTPPSAEEMAIAADVNLTDAAVVHDALSCCVQFIAAPGRVLKYTVGPVRTIGPEGGCAGVEARVSIVLQSCPCPPDGSIPDAPGAP